MIKKRLDKKARPYIELQEVFSVRFCLAFLIEFGKYSRFTLLKFLIRLRIEC